MSAKPTSCRLPAQHQRFTNLRQSCTLSSSPDPESRLDIPVLVHLAQHDTSALANYTTEAGGVSARTILWWLVFTGTAMNYVVRMSITIAIVAMVKGHNLPRKNNLSFSSECFNATERYRATNISYMSTNTTKVPTDDEKDKVDWDEYEQNMVLASPYWLYWLTQLFSGYATRHYGSKVVFGLSNYILCLLGLFVPFATFHSFHLLIFLMALQGAFGGFVWPSLHAVTAAWVPPNERSKFITSYSGNSLGSALTLPLCGQLIHWFGWPSVFYVTGVLGTLWYTAWVLFMFDSPEKHPRISSSERNYILEQIGKAKTNEKLSAPWLKIFTSVNVWLIIFVQWGTYWCLFTAITQTPTYLYTLHGWDIKMLRTNITEDRLNSLTIVSIEGRLLDKRDLSAIIDQFAQQESRRKIL
uniref:Major facilitator superfamily (MFS) profile domain-containing protein n=1 Tax=Timema poppense TaxID=170557 RepID=A0A7R9GYB3_TIMPO|nr:unnamed protein product [Timema poppensis]